MQAGKQARVQAAMDEPPPSTLSVPLLSATTGVPPSSTRVLPSTTGVPSSTGVPYAATGIPPSTVGVHPSISGATPAVVAPLQTAPATVAAVETTPTNSGEALVASEETAVASSHQALTAAEGQAVERAEEALEGCVPASAPTSGVHTEHAATGGEHDCPALELLPAKCRSQSHVRPFGAFIDGVFIDQPSTHNSNHL